MARASGSSAEEALMDAVSADELMTLKTRLLRERNRAVFAVREARHAVDETFASLEVRS